MGVSCFLPDPDSMKGKIFLTVFDKLILGAVIAFCGFVISNHWSASTVRAELIKEIPDNVITKTAELTFIISELPLSVDNKKNVLIEKGLVIIDEMQFWISMADRVMDEKCDAIYLKTLKSVKSQIRQINSAQANSFRSEIVNNYPSILECIKTYQQKSVSFWEIFK